MYDEKLGKMLENVVIIYQPLSSFSLFLLDVNKTVFFCFLYR